MDERKSYNNAYNVYEYSDINYISKRYDDRRYSWVNGAREAFRALYDGAAIVVHREGRCTLLDALRYIFPA